MVLGTLRIVLIISLYLSSFLCLVSFGSISFISRTTIEFLLATGFVLWFSIRIVQKDFQKVNFLFPWFSCFLLWLILQKIGQELHLPFFWEGTAPWTKSINIFSVFLAGFGLYLITQEVLKSRGAILIFLRFWVVVSSVIALYVIYVFLLLAYRNELSLPFIAPLRPWVGGAMYENYLAKLFIPGAFYSLSLFFYALTLRRDGRNLQKVYSRIFLHLCFVCVLVTAIFVTKSRGGILAFLGAACFYFMFFLMAHQRRSAALKRLLVVLIIAVLFLLSVGIKDAMLELQTLLRGWSEQVTGGLLGFDTRLRNMGACWLVIQKG